MDQLTRLLTRAGLERTDGLELGYFDAQADQQDALRYDDGAEHGTSEDYQAGYALGY
jgi:hypothetical protein